MSLFEANCKTHHPVPLSFCYDTDKPVIWKPTQEAIGRPFAKNVLVQSFESVDHFPPSKVPNSLKVHIDIWRQGQTASDIHVFMTGSRVDSSIKIFFKKIYKKKFRLLWPSIERSILTNTPRLKLGNVALKIEDFILFHHDGITLNSQVFHGKVNPTQEDQWQGIWPMLFKFERKSNKGLSNIEFVYGIIDYLNTKSDFMSIFNSKQFHDDQLENLLIFGVNMHSINFPVLYAALESLANRQKLNTETVLDYIHPYIRIDRVSNLFSY